MSVDEKLMTMLQGKFDYEGSLVCATPSGNYFWYRKRQEVLKLLKRNYNTILASEREKTKPSLFVDIGCGESIDLFLIRNFLGEQGLTDWHFLGLEANPSSLEICNLKKQYYQSKNVDFIPVDVTKKLPFQDDEVDIIYCSEVIEHILEPELFLLEIKRVTKPNGYLILTTPNEPNVFQTSYWIRNRFEKMQAQMQAMKQQYQQVNIEAENLFLYGHISLRTIKEWDNTLNKIGFKNFDYGRGAITYGATPFFDNEWISGTRFLFEAFLDLFPRQWVCNLSDQLIGLYKLEK